MQTTKRLSDLSVIQQLQEDPHGFQLMQALCILLHWQGECGHSREQVLKHTIRFENSVALEFPASEVAGLKVSQAKGEMKIELVAACFGLLGLGGTLPLAVTERIASVRKGEGNAAPFAFMNMLSQRLSAQFFQAWAKNRLEHTDGGQLPLLLAFAGKPQHGAGEPHGIPPNAIGYYAALIGGYPVAANTISRVLTEYFNMPVELEPFFPVWDEIPEKRRSTLGSRNPKLGYGAVLGQRLRRRDIAVRLIITSRCTADTERFLPRQTTVRALENMLSLFGLGRLKIAVCIKLPPSHLQRVTLTSKTDAARRLGWDAFLVGRNGRVTRDSIEYLLPLKTS